MLMKETSFIILSLLNAWWFAKTWKRKIINDTFETVEKPKTYKFEARNLLILLCANLLKSVLLDFFDSLFINSKFFSLFFQAFDGSNNNHKAILHTTRYGFVL